MSARNNAEEVKWVGGVSQYSLLNTYILCFLFCWLVVPVFYAVWKWLQLNSVEYTVTSQRLRVRYGVFSRTTDDLELYRIRDLQLHEPLMLRLFSLSNLKIVSSDDITPVLELSAISDGGQVRDLLRELTEDSRIYRGVREII